MHSNEQHFPGIFEPFELRGHRLQNRLVVTPMSRVSATPEGVPTSLMQTYYEAFAKGGFSMIITEGVYTDSVAAQAYPLQPGLVTPAQTQGWWQITQKVKQHGTLFIAQLMHAGAISQHTQHTQAPSAIQPLGHKMPEYGGGDGPFPLPRAMTPEDIATARQGFISAAQQAKAAGFDGVEIHAANGYLPDQFLTDYTNTRQDAYGGTMANRFRIIAEIIAGIRAVAPATFIIGLRLSEGKVNHLHYRWPGGAATARALLAEVAQAQPDYVHIAAELGNWRRECLYDDGTSFTSLAKEIVQVPVIANGGLHQPALAREVLTGGHADLLALGKAAIANPDWPARIQRGESTLPFHPGMIKPSAGIAHTWQVMAAQPL
ncbi:oxidoreductase [Chitinophaga japonensis]|uniref:2,4-dienoyl-CoA reductase-like NADH-dependent reductase (Old Yellow Enzyme family) n=1 Tax=Chitinophaga japonensis TaxID=104662 RepID=A0A562TCR4_CHIJA|nr:NADH:flavin oxidoreductase [Chitinophaga japonensis]TWI90790.1 2,4-dienoyl-CoA reductase-like NADH-dependent reductase (Old Yellow Enzyme family) [Chitinophaga japonensis]